GKAKAALALPVEPGVNDSVDAAHQFACRRGITKGARQPFDGVDRLLEAAAVAGRSIPAAQLMSAAGQVADEVSTQESRGAGDGDSHASSFPTLTGVACSPEPLKPRSCSSASSRASIMLTLSLTHSHFCPRLAD